MADTPTRRAEGWTGWCGAGGSSNTRPPGRRAEPIRCSRSPNGEPKKRGNTPPNTAWIPGSKPTPVSPNAGNSHTTPPSTGPDGPRAPALPSGAAAFAGSGSTRNSRAGSHRPPRKPASKRDTGRRIERASGWRKSWASRSKTGRCSTRTRSWNTTTPKDERGAATSRWPPNITARERSRPRRRRGSRCTATGRQRGGPLAGRWAGDRDSGRRGGGLGRDPASIEL